jgi:hypothetical protein
MVLVLYGVRVIGAWKGPREGFDLVLKGKFSMPLANELTWGS